MSEETTEEERAALFRRAEQIEQSTLTKYEQDYKRAVKALSFTQARIERFVEKAAGG